MPQKTSPRATVYPNATVLQFPYDAELVDALKCEIPAYSRTFDPATKAWTVKAPHTDRAIRLLREFFPGAEVATASGQRRHTPPPRRPEPMAAPRHFTILHVTPDAPPEVVNAAFKALVKLCHPDALPAPQRDQAHQRMCAINAAYEALRSEGRV